MLQPMSTPAPGPPCILFVDDNADVQQAAALLLARRGFSVLRAPSPDQAWSVLAERTVDVVLLDLNFRPGATNGSEGLAMLERLLLHDPGMVVVVITAHSGIAIAVAAMRAGAADFVMKPWNNERLVATLNDAVALRRHRRLAGSALVGGASTESPMQGTVTPLIGESAAVRHILEQARRAAATDASIMLLGEAGTGKTVLAHAVHRMSSRSGRALHVLDAAALRDASQTAFDTLFEALDAAGTLLIEEAPSLTLLQQRWLLDRLAAHPGPRLIGTSRQSRSALRQGALLSDLLDRLGTVDLALPPLRERGDDARLLAEHALWLAARRHRHGAMSFSSDALATLVAGDFPDNVRGLLHVVERAVVLAQHDMIEARDIPTSFVLPSATPAPERSDLDLQRSEKTLITAALRRHGFNVSHAARELGLTRPALYRRMARHQL